MFENLGKTIARRPQLKAETLQWGPWTDGLVTEYQPEQMSKGQLYQALNMVMVGSGVARTRNGSSLVCSGCTGSIVQVKDIKVGPTWYTIISDTDNKLYWNNSGTATAIATLEGEPQFCGFMGLLIIFDGSFIKSWDGNDVKILYDNGTGANAPYQVNKRNDTATTDKPLGNGTITSVELAFTSQDWDAGYTIPPTHIYAQLYKIGSPTGTITAKLKTDADVEMASTDITTTVASLTTDSAGEEYEGVFDLDSEVITEMGPGASLKIVLEYSGGDASNYVNVKAVDASNPMLSLKPGRPPKAAFGLVHEDRLHCIEGETGDNPSYMWYCAAGNQLDWSTADGGGYAPAIDQSATNYPIGGIASWNSGLWIFGTQRQPFLGLLSGESPSSWVINSTMQRVSGHYKSIVVTPDNITFLHPSGIDMVSAVQESSDIAAESQADNIRKTIQEHFSTAAVSGYDPTFGLYCLKLDGIDDVVVINTRSKSVKYRGQKSQAFSPATFWRFAFPGAVTAFGDGNGFMYVGTDEGEVYDIDPDKYDEDGAGNTISFGIITASKPTVFGEAQAYKIGYRVFGRFGGKATVKFYRDYSRTSFFDLDFSLPIDSTLNTVDFDGVDTVDADFYASPDIYFDREDINFNFRNLMVGIEDIALYGGPMYFGDIRLDVRSIGGL